jgi:hypothetical protein
MTARITLRDKKEVGLDLGARLIGKNVEISKVSDPNKREVIAASIRLVSTAV